MSISPRSPAWGDPRALSARLNRRVVIQQVSETPDTAGGSVRSWSTLATVWAEIIPQRSGGERLFAGQIEADSTHRITIRYRNDVTTAMRIAYGTRYFNIRRISNAQEAGVLLVIEAEEGVAQ